MAAMQSDDRAQARPESPDRCWAELIEAGRARRWSVGGRSALGARARRVSTSWVTTRIIIIIIIIIISSSSSSDDEREGEEMQRESGRRGSQRRPRAPAALDLARARSHNRADRCSDPTTPQLGNSAAARPARSIAAAIASAAFADALAPVSHVGLIDAAALARSLVAHIAIVRPLGHERAHTHALSQSVSDGGRPTLAHAHTRTRSIERRAADASRPRSLGSQRAS